MLGKIQSVLLLSGLIFFQLGCADPHPNRELHQLDNQLKRLIDQFQNAERNFGPSTNADSLVKNAHWLDRMISYNKQIITIEQKAISLGADPITDLRHELRSRINRHIQTMQSDMHYVDAKHQFEIASIWLDM